MNVAGLSLEQAPPISAPFRFFLTAPLFLAAAGAVLLWYGPAALASRWAIPTLALTHLVTLGFLAMVMFGAITQMLPVLAGAPIPRVRLVAGVTHGLLVTGVAVLVAAFLGGKPAGLVYASVLLACAILLFVSAATVALVRARGRGFFVVGVGAALASLIVTASLGVALAVGMGGLPLLSNVVGTTDLHLTWGILGWIGLLILGVAYQVVPMFHVPAPYPEMLRRLLVPSILALLIVWSGTIHLAPGSLLGRIPIALAGAGFVAFALFTLRLFHQRRRKTPDIALPFWRLGLSGVGLGAALWVAGTLVEGLPGLALGMALLLIGATSIVNGMLYKIVPFLSWFHLQSRQVRSGRIHVRIPNAANLLPPRMARIQFFLHLGACSLCLAAVWRPQALTQAAGVVLIASALLLWFNLVRAVLAYRKASAMLSALPPPDRSS